MADNGTVNANNTNWPVPGGIESLRPGTLHVRVHDPREEVDIAADFAVVTEPLLAAGARVVYAHLMYGQTYLLALARKWEDPQIEIVNNDSLLTLTAGLYRAWHYAEPGQQVVLIVGDWINVYTDGLGGHSDEDANRWLHAALGADLDALAEVTGLAYEGYIKKDRPLRPVYPVIVVDGVLRRRALRPDAPAPTLADLMGGSRLVSLAESIVRFEWLATDPGKSRTARVTPMKSRRAPFEAFEVTRQLVKPFWEPVA